MFGASLPFYIPPYWLDIATLAVIASIFAIGLNLLMGYTGLDSLGQAAFFGMAAYVVGILTATYGTSWALAAPAGLAAATALAGAFGLIAVRLRGLYFLLITLALGQVLWGAANRWGDLTGGANGLSGVTMPFDWLVDPAPFYWFALVILVVVGLAAHLIIESPFGLSLKAIRERELRSTTLGFQTYRHKWVVFVIAGFMAAVAGELSAAYNGFVSTEDLSLTSSFQVMLMVILGGTGTFWGPIVGAFGIQTLQYELSTQLKDGWLLVLGVIYIAGTIWLPGGLVGLADRVASRVRARRATPSADGEVAADGVPAGTPLPPPAAVEGAEVERVTTVTPPARPSGGETVLDVDEVSKSFGDVKVLTGVSMTVRAGERVGIIGLNGAGKTTLFHTISGLQRPTSGHILVAGQDVTRLPANKRTDLGLARTFQVTTLYPGLTAVENVVVALLGRRYRHLQLVMWRRVRKLDDLLERAHELLAAVGIREMADVQVRYLSYGHQRQVEVALALASEPALLLLDEPTAGLAQSETPAMVRLLRALPAELTLLIVEHNLELIFQVVDRVVVLHEGRVIVDDDAPAVRENPEVRELYFGSGAGRADRPHAAPAVDEAQAR